MDNEIFGSTLQVKDAFSNTFTAFANGVNDTKEKFNGLDNSINKTAMDMIKSGQSMRSVAATLAGQYRKMGMSQADAMKKAWSEIERGSKESSENTEKSWKNTFNSIKDKGVTAFKSLNSAVDSFSKSTTGMITKITAGFVSVASAKKGLELGLKTGIEYEASRMTLDTLYGDKTLGGEKFKIATNFANKTPWEESETVGSLVKMKAYNLKDTEEFMTQMSDLGAAFKSMGQNMDTATEAYADMMNGEWERMKSFGIKRESLEQFAKDNNLGKFTNKKGQITNKDKLEEVFKAYMDDKGYTGMTESLSNTATGKLSTATGNLKKSLAELVGITEDGGVRDGSLFDSFTRGMETFTSKLNEFSKSESFDKISSTLGDIGNAFVDGFSYITEHPDIAVGLIKLGVGLTGLSTVSKVISPLSNVISLGKLIGTTLITAGGAIAPFLAPLVGAVGGFWALSSVLSDDGVLHQGISWLLGNIPGIGDELQNGFEEGTSIIRDWFDGTWNWIKSKLGFENTDDEYAAANHTEDTEFNRKWYPENFKTADNVSEYKTVSNMYKSGDITKTDNSNSIGNINMPITIEKVEKDADVDNIMNEVASRMKKYQATRNALG